VSFYTRALRPALFALDAERAHDLTMAALRRPLVVKTLRRSDHASFDRQLSQRIWGLDFRNPLGLAAGLDKQGTALPAWSALGFGFAEIGTVTPLPQPGNPKPRLFRLPRDRAIINRFGFNSAGAEAVARNLSHSMQKVRLKPDTTAGLRIGINVGKNKDTPNERAVGDYVRAIEVLHPFADYFAINVSSPNTEGLRNLQESGTLRSLVEQVVARVAQSAPRPIPVLVKISPDVAETDLLRSVEAAVEGGAQGVIATNTTVSRPALTDRSRASEAGGLSGLPLRSPANSVCRLLFRHLGTRVPIVGVGGIFTADDAYDRIRSGAALVQMYTGLIYEGPGMIQRLMAGLVERLTRDGFTRIDEAVGIDAR
jgi:dihydroorotate dehydrogenase